MLDDSRSFSCQDHPCSLNIDAHGTRDELVLVFSGEADAAAGPLLAHALAQASRFGHRRLAMDLTDLEFIDTHCLGIIFDTHEKLRDRGADLVLLSPQPPVRRLLDILARQELIQSA